MRVRVERTYVTTESGTRAIVSRPEYTTIEADSLGAALLEFIHSDGGRLLGTITETANKAVATVWKRRVYLLCAEAAPD